MRSAWLFPLLIISVLCSGQGSKRSSTPHDKGESCLFDFQRGGVPDCIRKSASGSYVIAPRDVKDLDLDPHGLAPVRSGSHGWMYVNKRGIVVVWGVPTFDNWADEFHNGLVRVLRNGKYGYANRNGTLVIRPEYEGALSFGKGTAVVCRQCRTATDGEHSWFTGGNWFRIDRRGKVIQRLRPR